MFDKEEAAKIIESRRFGLKGEVTFFQGTGGDVCSNEISSFSKHFFKITESLDRHCFMKDLYSKYIS